MNKSKVSGDSVVVFGAPTPKEENELEVPPKTANKKIIEEGQIIIAVEPNNREIINKLEEQKGDKEH